MTFIMEQIDATTFASPLAGEAMRLSALALSRSSEGIQGLTRHFVTPSPNPLPQGERAMCEAIA